MGFVCRYLTHARVTLSLGTFEILEGLQTENAMLNKFVSAILAEFTLSTVAFTHYDVAACIANLSAQQVSQIERLVFCQMSRMPGYRISLVNFAGEGLTLLYSPLYATFSAMLADMKACDKHMLAL